MNELKNFFLGVQQVAQDAVDKAPYDRTFRGVIENVNNDGTCNVRINGRTYNNVKCPIGINANDVVDVLFPQNNTSQMEIVHRGDNIDTVIVTNDTTNFTGHNQIVKKYNNLGMCFARFYCSNTVNLTASGIYDMFSIPVDVSPSNIYPFSVRCNSGSTRYGVAVSISSSGIVQARPLETIPSGASFYISGFWFI